MNPDLDSMDEWLELNVLIKYEEEKNAHYKQLSAAEVLVHLRQHLTALRMSHPKGDNVRPVTGDGIRFFWHTQKGSPLHKSLITLVKARGRTGLKECCIEGIELRVKSIARPAGPLLLPASSRGDSFSNRAPIDSPVKKRTNEMHDNAQEFLDGLRLEPRPVPLASLQRSPSIASSTRSSRHEIPSVIKHEMSATPERDAMELLESQNSDVNMELVEESESEDMIIDDEDIVSFSPIPGLTVFPMSETIRTEPAAAEPLAPFDVQPTLRESDMPLVHQLSMALLDIRQEVASGLVKERAILQALKIFNAPDIPTTESPEDGFIAKVRLQMLKSDLENVRLKREAVEASIKEIGKECRAPFVCPALMDAFIGVSRLSTQALGAEN
ncbi:hypothetical protein C8R44DRAFT_367953 [Mycena epipterygia]|nr:hypothetical protein C8R44DRAFT_367953 [Mycena epipterygia]